MRRRRLVVAATALLVLGLVALASPAVAAPRPWPASGPVARLDCSVSGGGVYWAQPIRSGIPGWDYYSDSAKPDGVLMYYGTTYGNQPTTGLTLCAVHAPVKPGTDVYDGSWGPIPEETFFAYFLFF